MVPPPDVVAVADGEYRRSYRRPAPLVASFPRYGHYGSFEARLPRARQAGFRLTRTPTAQAEPPWGYEHRRPRPTHPAPLERRGARLDPTARAPPYTDAIERAVGRSCGTEGQRQLGKRMATPGRLFQHRDLAGRRWADRSPSVPARTGASPSASAASPGTEVRAQQGDDGYQPASWSITVG
jgi:hypothetical protein